MVNRQPLPLRMLHGRALCTVAAFFAGYSCHVVVGAEGFGPAPHRPHSVAAYLAQARQRQT